MDDIYTFGMFVAVAGIHPNDAELANELWCDAEGWMKFVSSDKKREQAFDKGLYDMTTWAKDHSYYHG